jgi:hypothetical protein
MGGFSGGRIGGFDGGRIGGLGADHVGGPAGDHMARLDHDHLGAGRRHFGGYYGYGLDCPYYPNYSSDWPDTCGY